jgi:hypothetical protein
VLLAAVCMLLVLHAAHHPGRPHADRSNVLLLMLLVVSMLAPPSFVAIPEGRVNSRRVALVSGIAVAVAILAFAAGYYASRAAG